MEGFPEDMWTPHKNLQKFIEQMLSNPGSISLPDLEMCLKKYKQTFSMLLRNPPKNERNRHQLLNGIIEGITIPGRSHSAILSKDLVDESIILSNMYDLDEFIALELLCTAQRQMPQHPGLPRGLVAIMLYYDGRRAITYSLRDLFQATSGVSWVTELPKELTHVISSFTQGLVEESNILERIVNLIEELDASKEVALLTKNRAFGPKKHQNQVLEMFEDIRLALATALFNWSAQRGLPKTIVLRLIEIVAKYKSTEPSGTLDNVAVTMLMTLLYSFDVSVLQRQDDSLFLVQNLPILNDVDFPQKVCDAFLSNNVCEEKSRLYSTAKFAFGLSLASLRHASHNIQNAALRVIEYDEQLIDDAIGGRVFEVFFHYILEKDIVYKSEFFYRRLHTLFTDFIDFMHSKVTELRGRADETARTIMSFTKEGLEPPSNLDRSFEMLLLCIGKLYKDNRSGLSLCMEYWGPLDNTRSNNRSVSLFKFIRLAGELLPTNLFIPYLKMIAGLTSCERSARNTFNLLKQSSGLSGSPTLSWEHFFGSLARYYSNLRQDHIPGNDTIYRNRAISCSINPHEIEGLHAVLEVIRAVATYDEIARITICEHPNWAPLHVLLGLLSCSVPLLLKADILKTLAALAKSKETAVNLWNNLEASQIIRTIPATSAYNVCNIEMEIEQNECRIESYPVSQGILEILHTLVTTVLPKNLGGGVRKPGFEPYLHFILNGIFYKFYNRNYKNSSEKWQVGEKCLNILYYLLKAYQIKPEDFNESCNESTHPGFNIMLELQVKSNMLNLILLIIEEARLKIDEYNKFYGRETLERCALLCLQVIQCGLEKQQLFFDAHSISNSSLLISGLNKILLEVNPRSRKPDYILNTSKFITYSSWLPFHALVAIKILNSITRLPSATFQILGMFTQNDFVQTEIRQGFVECLETEVKPCVNNSEEGLPSHESANQKIELNIKEAIIELLQDCLLQPMTNLTHFLIGFQIRRDGNANQKQKFAIIDPVNNNCMKSLVALLDQHLEVMRVIDAYDMDIERIIEKAYCLLFSLCVNQQTSDAILRYLRSSNDFLRRHLAALPFKNFGRSHVLNQMNYLLKCTAIELKTTAMNCQISRFQGLIELLVGSSATAITNAHAAKIPTELNLFTQSPNMLTTTTTRSSSMKNVPENSSGYLLAYLLDCFDFDVKLPPTPKWDYFDNSLTNQILNQSQTKAENGQKLIDIIKLHEILNDELRGVQSTIASGQRKLILQEIQSVLLYALRINQTRNKHYATIKLMEAWSQVTETLFICSSESTLPFQQKQELILDVLEKILNKIVPNQPILELSVLSSETVLMLLVNLRCFYSKNANPSVDNYERCTPPKSIWLSLRFVLKNVVEWIISSGVSSQKLRINLYAALLNCLCIVKRTERLLQKDLNECYISRLDTADAEISMEFNQFQLTIEVFQSFGEKLIDMFCHDCISGHDICNMAALSCIDILLNLDPMPAFINFIAKRGYLSTIIGSLQKSDDNICKVLTNSPENMKYLYIYESKMAMLLRIANSHLGAELLLTNRILSTLSSMKVFDLHPDCQGSGMLYAKDGDQFLPTVYERFRQILFPALTLCDAMISTLGLDNHSVISQIMHFILSHCDMIEIVLRNGSISDLGHLKELAGVTGLIARITNQETFSLGEDSFNRDVNSVLFRIQRLMLSAFGRFVINGPAFKELIKNENTSSDVDESRTTELIKYFLQIASNLTFYCRNAIANHSADHRANKVLFSPSVIEIVERENINTSLKIHQSLILVINQLKGVVEFFNCRKFVSDNLQRQRSLINISFDTSAQSTYQQITQKIQTNQNELSFCNFITEQCLYLLWAHLDYFLRRTQTSMIGASDGKLSDFITAYEPSIDDDISALKKTLISIFNETFCKQLLATSESINNADKCFNEALLRRIKSLIQLAPSCL